LIDPLHCSSEFIDVEKKKGQTRGKITNTDRFTKYKSIHLLTKLSTESSAISR